MKKILVIEDDRLARASMVTALRRNGYDVLDAADGEAGLQLAFSLRPDIVLIDVNLPVKNGFEVLKGLRARAETAAMPVVLMTGEPHQADARYSMNQGADDYLQKPFTMEQMLATLTARLERQTGIRRAVEATTRAERISAAEKIRLQSTALEAAANGIVITDSQGKILWVNPAFTRLTGYTADEAIGQNPRLLRSGRHPQPFYAGLWAAIVAGKVWHGELVNRRKDGTCYDEEMTVTPVLGEDGRIQHFIAIKQDVSERKIIEQALAYKRDLLQALMDNLPDYIYFKDANSRFTRVNQAYANYLGLTATEEAIGRSDMDFFPLVQARQKLVDERRLLATGEPILGLVEKCGAAQGDVWVSTTKVPINGANGEIAGMVGISRDITKIKQAEEELQRKSAFLEAQVNSAMDGILVVDERGRKVLQNQRLIHLLKLPPSVAKDEGEAQLRWVTEQAREPEEFIGKIQYLLSHRDETSHDEVELKDGTILYRYSAPMLGKNGAYYGRLWTFHDITERKRMEVSLRQSEEKFRQLANNVSDVFWITSPDLRQIHYVNPAYERIWGRTMASLYADPDQRRTGIVPDDRERVGSVFSTLVSGAAEVSAEYRVARPDGTIRWVHDRGFQVRDAGGRIVRLAGIASDITERKRLETELYQARKLESIGQLAAGVAHEMNTPTQYVGDNTRFVKDSFAAVAKILDSHAALLSAAKAGAVPAEMLARSDELLATSDLEYLRTQIPQALTETLEGIERVTKIVRAMKEFSHPGGREKALADLNKAIESTVTVARNEWKYVAELKLDLDRGLPFVPCYLGEFNQIVLNLVVNAAHAIGDVVKQNPGARG